MDLWEALGKGKMFHSEDQAVDRKQMKRIMKRENIGDDINGWFHINTGGKGPSNMFLDWKKCLSVSLRLRDDE